MGDNSGPPDGRRHHLLTSSDLAQLEHFRFLEVLENSTGPLAFGGVSRDPADLTKALYPNEWALRCLVEGGHLPAEGEKLLDRWRRATRRVERKNPVLGKRDAAHIATVFRRRRDPEAPFDEYFFNFDALSTPDELPLGDDWSARELEAAWVRPATFALGKVFGVEPWRDGARELTRGEGWMIGRLVHRWLHAALRGSKEPRQLNNLDWQHALTAGLAQARTATETRVRAMSSGRNIAPGVPLWWQGVLHKAEWAARRCLETLADAASGTDGNRWLVLDREFRAELPTPAGRLRLRAHCDVLLLDGPEVPGAACQIIDIRTGAVPSAGPPSAAQIQNGRGLGEAALLFLAMEEGALAEGTQASAVHPDVALVNIMGADAAGSLRPALERLAARQRSLCFGQRGAIVESGHGGHDAENLPLATTPVDPAILAAKGLQNP